MIDGFTTWKLHRAIKLHLLTKGYDVFKLNGHVKGMTHEKFLKQRDRKIFEILGKQFQKPQEAVQFFVANIAYSGKDEIYDTTMAWENYLLWLKHKESLTKLICDDLDMLNLDTDLEGNPPRLLQGLLGGKVLPETAVAINRYKPFIDDWIQKDYFGLGNWGYIIKKLDKFVKFNESTVKDKIMEHISEAF